MMRNIFLALPTLILITVLIFLALNRQQSIQKEVLDSDFYEDENVILKKTQDILTQPQSPKSILYPQIDEVERLIHTSIAKVKQSDTKTGSLFTLYGKSFLPSIIPLTESKKAFSLVQNFFKLHDEYSPFFFDRRSAGTYSFYLGVLSFYKYIQFHGLSQVGQGQLQKMLTKTDEFKRSKDPYIGFLFGLASSLDSPTQSFKQALSFFENCKDKVFECQQLYKDTQSTLKATKRCRLLPTKIKIHQANIPSQNLAKKHQNKIAEKKGTLESFSAHDILLEKYLGRWWLKIRLNQALGQHFRQNYQGTSETCLSYENNILSCNKMIIKEAHTLIYDLSNSNEFIKICPLK